MSVAVWPRSKRRFGWLFTTSLCLLSQPASMRWRPSGRKTCLDWGSIWTRYCWISCQCWRLCSEASKKCNSWRIQTYRVPTLSSCRPFLKFAASSLPAKTGLRSAKILSRISSPLDRIRREKTLILWWSYTLTTSTKILWKTQNAPSAANPPSADAAPAKMRGIAVGIVSCGSGRHISHFVSCLNVNSGGRWHSMTMSRMTWLFKRRRKQQSVP